VKIDEETNLVKSIQEKWGCVEDFKKEFDKAALEIFGSGWAWLIKDKSGTLKIIKTFNQDTPIFLKMKPIIGIDVWEHSYYLKHRGARAEYIKEFWQVVNWDKCEELFNE
jgi:Fe-Mn family superoxide dismutase